MLLYVGFVDTKGHLLRKRGRSSMDEPNITITIPEGKFEFLKSTLNSHKDFIHRLGISEVLKDSLIRDTHIIKTIIDTGKKGV